MSEPANIDVLYFPAENKRRARCVVHKIGESAFVAIYAACSLEGWGSVSEEFTSEFLKVLLKASDIQESGLSNQWERLVNSAFQNAGSRFVEEFKASPEWVTGQYVAVIVERGSLTMNWIGDVHGQCWDPTGLVAANTSDILIVPGKDGPTTLITKALRLIPRSAEDVGSQLAPHACNRTLTCFVGNFDLAKELDEVDTEPLKHWTSDLNDDQRQQRLLRLIEQGGGRNPDKADRRRGLICVFQ